MDIEQRAYNQIHVLNGNAEPIGCGFICGPRHVMTCTHVADDAVTGATTVSPGSKIRGILPNLNDKPFRLGVRHFYRDKAMFRDICLLELDVGERFPEGHSVATFNPMVLSNGLEFVGSGIQKVATTGYSLNGWVREKNGDWFEIESNDKEGAVEPGCSGGALYHKDDGIIGMIAERQLFKRGFIIPTRLLCDFLREAGLDPLVATASSASQRAGWGNNRHLIDGQGQHEDFSTSAATSSEAAKAALELSRQLFELEKRPWVTIQDVKVINAYISWGSIVPGWEYTLWLTLEYYLVNSGMLPAKNVLHYQEATITGRAGINHGSLPVENIAERVKGALVHNGQFIPANGRIRVEGTVHSAVERPPPHISATICVEAGIFVAYTSPSSEVVRETFRAYHCNAKSKGNPTSFALDFESIFERRQINESRPLNIFLDPTERSRMT